MQPATRPINFGSDKLGQDQKDNAREVHRQRAPTDPTVMNQTGHHERKDTDGHPIRLLSPEIGCVRVTAAGSRAIDRYDSKDSEREHGHEQKPVLAKQLS